MATPAELGGSARGEKGHPRLVVAEVRVAALGRTIAATRARLEEAGVQFRGDILDSGVCFQAFFADPDGNPLALHHRYAPKA